MCCERKKEKRIVCVVKGLKKGRQKLSVLWSTLKGKKRTILFNGLKERKKESKKDRFGLVTALKEAKKNPVCVFKYSQRIKELFLLLDRRTAGVTVGFKRERKKKNEPSVLLNALKEKKKERKKNCLCC